MSSLREPFNGLSHLVASYISLFGMLVLVTGAWDDGPKRLSVAIYGASLTIMLVASAAYHSIQCDADRELRFRKIDHAAIFALIAGTYTPLSLNLFSGFWQWGLLIIIWGMAIAGMISKIFRVGENDWFIVSVYFGAGWFSLFSIGEIFRVLPTGAIAWLFSGGLFYSLGAILSAFKVPDPYPGVFGHHEVWHIFVLAAAFCHYMLIYVYVLPA